MTRFRVRVAGEAQPRLVEAESCDAALAALVAAGEVPLSITGEDASLLGQLVARAGAERPRTAERRSPWRWWTGELAGAARDLAPRRDLSADADPAGVPARRRLRIWLDEPAVTMGTLLVPRGTDVADVLPEADALIWAARPGAAGREVTVMRVATLAKARAEALRRPFAARGLGLPALWTRIDGMAARLAREAPPAPAPVSWTLPVAALLLASIPVSTAVGAWMLARDQPLADAVATADAQAAFARPPVTATLRWLAARLPAEARVETVGRDAGGRLELELATADPDALRAALAADPRLVRMEVAGETRLADRDHRVQLVERAR